MAVTPQQLKDTFDDFDSTDPVILQLAIDQANRQVCIEQWGPTRFDDGVLYLSAHLTKLITEGDALGSSAVTSERVARVAASYQQVSGNKEIWLSSTSFGRMYLYLSSLVFADRKV
ncbi:MAG: DUF4054 domain-containing protein [Gammaproteobacteria bacterium]|nr:DUF4054 domain-containing protein [Gammaproteobacteria bacterium]